MYRFISAVNPTCTRKGDNSFVMEPFQRLKIAREKAGYAMASDAARAFGWMQVTYRHHENGTRNFTKDRAIAYARAFKVSPEWLMLGRDGLERPSLPVVGIVGAGAEIYPYDDGGSLSDVETPPGLRKEAVAVMVRGDSMFPRYFDGDLLIYDEHVSMKAAHGQECVISLIDGRKLVKTVRFHNGTATLESYNGAPIFDAQIEWVAPIKWVKRNAKH